MWTSNVEKKEKKEGIEEKPTRITVLTVEKLSPVSVDSCG